MSDAFCPPRNNGRPILMKKHFAMMILITLSGCGLNLSPTYGDSGAPKNCRAIIKENINAWRLRQISPEGALNSIDRNCDENGYFWGD
jgi:hypothetical protein